MKNFLILLVIFQSLNLLVFGLNNPKCPQINNGPRVRCTKPECILDQDCLPLGEKYACVITFLIQIIFDIWFFKKFNEVCFGPM